MHAVGRVIFIKKCCDMSEMMQQETGGGKWSMEQVLREK
jgi:hypothetical protein